MGLESDFLVAALECPKTSPPSPDPLHQYTLPPSSPPHDLCPFPDKKPNQLVGVADGSWELILESECLLVDPYMVPSLQGQ